MESFTARHLLFSPAGTWYVSSNRAPSPPPLAAPSSQLHPYHAVDAKLIALPAAPAGSRHPASVTSPSARKASTSRFPKSFHTFSSLTTTILLALIPLAGVHSAGICSSKPRPT